MLWYLEANWKTWRCPHLADLQNLSKKQNIHTCKLTHTYVHLPLKKQQQQQKKTNTGYVTPKDKIPETHN